MLDMQSKVIEGYRCKDCGGFRFNSSREYSICFDCRGRLLPPVPIIIHKIAILSPTMSQAVRSTCKRDTLETFKIGSFPGTYRYLNGRQKITVRDGKPLLHYRKSVIAWTITRAGVLIREFIPIQELLDVDL